MTGLRPRRMPNRLCWPRSIGFTAFPVASNRLATTRATLASSSTETELARPMRDEERTMTSRTPADRHRTLRLLSALAGLSVVLGACTHTDAGLTASVPDDYRLRHPIAIQEADRSVVIFVGHERGGLSASQRADVMGLAQTWVREGTGAILGEGPVDIP